MKICEACKSISCHKFTYVHTNISETTGIHLDIHMQIYIHTCLVYCISRKLTMIAPYKVTLAQLTYGLFEYCYLLSFGFGQTFLLANKSYCYVRFTTYSLKCVLQKFILFLKHCIPHVHLHTYSTYEYIVVIHFSKALNSEIFRVHKNLPTDRPTDRFFKDDTKLNLAVYASFLQLLL